MSIERSLVDPAPAPDEQDLTGSPLGVVGTTYGYGFGSLSGEEYNPNLAPMLWRGYAADKGIADRMMREDSVCAAIGMIITKPLESASWTIQPVSDEPIDLEVADFCRAALFKLPRETWRSRLSQILNFPLVGFHLEEPVYRLQTDGDWKGKIIVDRFAPRLPNTVDEWMMDTEERLQGVGQVNYAGGIVPTPLRTSKAGFTGLMRYSFQQLGNNWEGRGLLRALYRPYMMRRDAWLRWAIAVERWSTGIPVMEGVPSSLLDSYGPQIETMLQNLRGHGKSWAYTPDGATIKLLGPDAGGGSLVKDLINECASEMAIGTLTMLLMLGRDTGTYNLGEVQQGVLADAFQSIAKTVCEVHNHGTDGVPGILESLVTMNFGPNVEVPDLIVTGIADLTPLEVFKAIASGGSSGFIQPHKGDDAFFREAFNMAAPLEPDGEDIEPEPEVEPESKEDEEPEADAPFDRGHQAHSIELAAVVRPDPNQSFTTWRELTKTERFVDWGSLERQQNNLAEDAGAIVLRHQRLMIDRYMPLLMQQIEALDPAGVQELEVPGGDALTADLMEVAERANAKGYASVASEWRRQEDDLPVFPEASELVALAGQTVQLADEPLPFPGATASGTTGATANPFGMPQDLNGQSVAAILLAYSSHMTTWITERIKSTGVTLGLSQIQSGIADQAAIEQSLDDLSAARATSQAGTVSTASFSTGRSVAGQVAEDAGLVRSVFYSAVLDFNTCMPCRETDAKHGEPPQGQGLTGDEIQQFRPPLYLCKGRNLCRCAQVFVFKGEAES